MDLDVDSIHPSIS